MLLPSQRINKIRNHKESTKNKQIEAYQMGKKAKKATDYDEILKEQQHLSNANERLTSSSISNQGFFSRSLSRISGRRKRQKKRTAAENFQDDNIRTKRENQVLHHQCSSTNDRNLNGLTHLEGDEARLKKYLKKKKLFMGSKMERIFKNFIEIYLN
ncbi:hypothetical protein Mgra_00002762 [Meloidogyne graminicola]|uniref:Uncharacterized protein n=1 Tax=Meloidogyne graminicola TaxID=189291 RepID=A0A8S9ZXD0_9BILA|nr:hypothetical protein Mgra_00002762 [Meloidogyne graminicola]